MRAILLAAGRGRRLESQAPKCLLEIEGKTLLERHLANLAEAGVDALTVVVGFQADVIRSFVAKLGATPLPVDFVDNPEFMRGSIVSLQKASHLLLEGAIWMDADVLYPAALMRRLVESANDNCVLLDRRSDETGEEMMLGVRGRRVLAIARRVSPLGAWDLVGEAVGFAKVGPEGGRVMKRLLDEEITAGRLDQEYEAAMNRAFGEIPWGFEPVDDFPWTEIDFQEDVEKAKRLARELR
jgi:choline kinase